MKQTNLYFIRSLNIIKQDKVIILLGIIPIIVGMILYFFLGLWLFTELLPWLQKQATLFIVVESWGVVLEYLLKAILMTVSYFVISWTFVMAVSLIACPFNDMISARAERAVTGGDEEAPPYSFKKTIKRLPRIFFVEIKKILFITLLSCLGILITLIPLLTPLGLLLASVLCAVSFVDYCWSRHGYSFRACFKNFWNNFFSYTIAGMITFPVLAIPLVNLLAIPFAIVYFSVLFCEKSGKTQKE